MRAIALSLVFASCATLEGTKPDLQVQLEGKLLGHKVYAQCALHRAEFFDDPTRDLVSAHRVGARYLALDSAGKPLPLKAKFNRVHPGSIWHIDRISFPTRYESIMRPLRSPRHLAWIHLLSGSSRAVLVIPEGLSDAEAVMKWLDERFGHEEPKGFDQLNPALRSAVTQGRLVSDMSEQDARLALCSPDRVFMDVRAAPPVQKWIYLHQGGDHRMAVLLEGKVTGKLLKITPEELKALEKP